MGRNCLKKENVLFFAKHVSILILICGKKGKRGGALSQQISEETFKL